MNAVSEVQNALLQHHRVGDLGCETQPEVHHHDVRLVPELVLSVVQRDVPDLEVDRVR